MKTIPQVTLVKIIQAVDFIEANLATSIVLTDISNAAHLSMFHFHRLFVIIVKETPVQYINRRRLEKSAPLLLYHHHMTVTEVPEIMGFLSLSSYSRAFKNYYGMSPTQFKRSGFKKYNTVIKKESKNGQIEVKFEHYICRITEALNWIKMHAIRIEIKKHHLTN